MFEHDYAAALASWIEGEECGGATDGLHLGPTDLKLVAKALIALAAIIVAVGSDLAPEKYIQL